jgi:DNA polymerase-3 subunit gamma/tau
MLKLLEEPPENVVFVLCTTERNKVPATIKTRCQSFSFQLLPWNLIAIRLKEVCEAEGVEIDDTSIRMIARSGHGHMRDALQNLDRVIGYIGGEAITPEKTAAAIGVASEESYFKLVKSITSKKYADAVLAVRDMLGSGARVEEVVEGLLEHLRIISLLAFCGNDGSLLPDLSEQEIKLYEDQRRLMKIDLIDDMKNRLVELHRGLYYNVNPQILFEQYVLRSIVTQHRLDKAVS